MLVIYDPLDLRVLSGFWMVLQVILICPYGSSPNGDWNRLKEPYAFWCQNLKICLWAKSHTSTNFSLPLQSLLQRHSVDCNPCYFNFQCIDCSCMNVSPSTTSKSVFATIWARLNNLFSGRLNQWLWPVASKCPARNYYPILLASGLLHTVLKPCIHPCYHACNM